MTEWITQNVLLTLIGVGGLSALLKLILEKFDIPKRMQDWFENNNDKAQHWVMTWLKPKADAGALWLGQTFTDWFQQSPNPIMKVVNIFVQFFIEPILIPSVYGLAGLLNVVLDALKALCVSMPAKFVDGFRHDNPKK
jgi:hypothetical protein